MEQLYDIYFAGQLVDGFDVATVRSNLAKLFKANDSALEKLFSGKPQAVKRGADKPAAIKYKAAMAKAGAVALIKAHPRAETAVESAPAFTDDDLPSSADIKPAAKTGKGGSLADRIAALAGDATEADAATPVVTDMTLAPAGSDILSVAERKVVQAAQIDTSAMQIQSNFTAHEPAVVDTPPAPDTSHLSMGQVGEDIPHLDVERDLLDPDISHLSMGEVGEDIPHLEIEKELLNPDTSSMSLAPEGSEVLEEQYKHRDQAKAPSTDHLALQDQAP